MSSTEAIGSQARSFMRTCFRHAPIGEISCREARRDGQGPALCRGYFPGLRVWNCARQWNIGLDDGVESHDNDDSLASKNHVDAVQLCRGSRSAAASSSCHPACRYPEMSGHPSPTQTQPGMGIPSRALRSRPNDPPVEPALCMISGIHPGCCAGLAWC
ncbi:hypothetical protein BGZ61DRAFT_461448 [Ilyonectria robusta]|uniref:uncharacterized protein n=1 Tax=Ilyonectria robusta TaxID=1079257 RepID=UPI001E8CF019|nr:uncharacterized protein BGZ61DRAFT_461448 [Ilyonectria robusta]KAH8667259.1 hypothetical protein BGZ61DRAFT_461448 [Ilyonectria robusta]